MPKNWVSIFIGMTLFCFAFFWPYFDGLRFCYSRECIEFFFGYFKTPLRVSAAVFAGVPFLLTLVRTITSIKSFEESRRQNIYANKFSHYSLFGEALDFYERRGGWLFSKGLLNKQKLFLSIYSDFDDGVFSIGSSAQCLIGKRKIYCVMAEQKFINGRFDFNEHVNILVDFCGNFGIDVIEIHEPQAIFEFEEEVYFLINIAATFWSKKDSLIKNEWRYYCYK